jgi:hypothetical protein
VIYLPHLLDRPLRLSTRMSPITYAPLSKDYPFTEPDIYVIWAKMDIRNAILET